MERKDGMKEVRTGWNLRKGKKGRRKAIKEERKNVRNEERKRKIKK